jgi:hypothetical protein
MTTLDDLYEEVAGIVHESSYDSDKVIALFNGAIRAISEIVLLPELETSGTVTTSTTLNYVALPDDYQRKLRDCKDTLNPYHEIQIYGSVPLMNAKFSRLDYTGPVVAVAPMGRSLFYQRRPSTATPLQINYYAIPEALQGHEEATIVPAFTDELLTNYACWKIYSVIEEGMDGTKTQTQFYQGQFMVFLNQLKDFIGPEQNKPIHIIDDLWGCWT